MKKCKKCEKTKNKNDYLEWSHVYCKECFLSKHKKQKVDILNKRTNKEFEDILEFKKSLNRGYKHFTNDSSNDTINPKVIGHYIEVLNFIDGYLIYDETFTYEQRRELLKNID